MLPDKRGSERLNQNLNMKCLFLNFGGFVNRRPKDTIYIYYFERCFEINTHILSQLGIKIIKLWRKIIPLIRLGGKGSKRLEKSTSHFDALNKVKKRFEYFCNPIF